MFFLPNLKMFLSATCTRSQSISLEIYFSIRLSYRFLCGDRPSLCEILGHRPMTFAAYEIILPSNIGKEWSLFKKSFLFLIYKFTVSSKGYTGNLYFSFNNHYQILQVCQVHYLVTYVL